MRANQTQLSPRSLGVWQVPSMVTVPTVNPQHANSPVRPQLLGCGRVRSRVEGTTGLQAKLTEQGTTASAPLGWWLGRGESAQGATRRDL